MPTLVPLSIARAFAVSERAIVAAPIEHYGGHYNEAEYIFARRNQSCAEIRIRCHSSLDRDWHAGYFAGPRPERTGYCWK